MAKKNDLLQQIAGTGSAVQQTQSGGSGGKTQNLLRQVAEQTASNISGVYYTPKAALQETTGRSFSSQRELDSWLKQQVQNGTYTQRKADELRELYSQSGTGNKVLYADMGAWNKIRNEMLAMQIDNQRDFDSWLKNQVLSGNYTQREADELRDRRMMSGNGDKMLYADMNAWNEGRNALLEVQKRGEAWKNQSLPAKALDTLKTTAKGTGAQIMANYAGAEAAIAGEGTVANDTYALLRSILDRNDGVTPWEAFDAYGNLFIQRGGGVIPGALERLYNEIGELAGKDGIHLDTENDIFSQWNNMLQEKRAAAEKAFYDKVGEVDNVFTKGQQYRAAKLAEINQKAAVDFSKSPAAQNFYKYGTMAGAQIPNVVVAAAASLLNPAAGATVAGGMATATTEGLQAYSALQQSSTFAQTLSAINAGLGAVTSNPAFWTSVQMETGSAYNEAIEAGVDPGRASTYAIGYGLLSGIIEVGGGDETLGGLQKMFPRAVREALETGNVAKAAWAFGKTVAQEIGEEEWQGALQNTMKGAVLGQDIPFYSTEDPNAIINWKQILETARDTAITTALLGAGERAMIGAAQTVADNKAYTGNAESLIANARAATESREIRQRIAEIRQDAKERAMQKGDNVGHLLTVGEARELQDIIRDSKGEAEAGKILTQANIGNAYEGAQIDEEGNTLSKDEASTLSALYDPQQNEARAFYPAAREAYQLGYMSNKGRSLSLAEAREYAKLSDYLTERQFEQAWRLGALRRVGGENKSVGEVKNEVRAHLAQYGEETANRLADLHDGTTTAEEYAALVDKALFYATHGADLQTVVEEIQSGLKTTWAQQDHELTKLTPEQITTIQELGPKIAAQRAAEVQRQDARLTQISEAAQGVTALKQVNRQLSAARGVLAKAEANLKEAEAEMRQMQDSGAWSTEEEAYNEVVRRVERLDDIIEKGKKVVQELEAKRAEAQNREPIKRKQGTVSFDESVDRENLTRDQKKVVAFVEALADAVNIDYVLYAGKDTQGGLYKDGMLHININAALKITKDGKVESRSVAGAILSHELTHYLQQYAPKEYEALRDFVIEKIRAEKGERGFSKLVQDQIDMERSVKKLSYDQAVDELVANSCITMLADSQTVKELARKNMTLAEKIADFLTDFAEKIRAVFEGVDIHDDSGLYDAARAMEKYFGEMQKMWDAALKSADVNYNAAQTAGETAGGAEQAMAWDQEDISRTFVPFTDINARKQMEESKMQSLIARGKTVTIPKAAINELGKRTDWSDLKKAREGIKSVLKAALGDTSVYFRYDGGTLTAYLTKEGRNHSAGGLADLRRGAIFTYVGQLIEQSEYIYSSEQDVHNQQTKRESRKTEWDSFEAVADIDNEYVPIIFSVKTNERDVRSRIHAIFENRESALPHDPGLNTQGGMSNYEDTTLDPKIAEIISAVKENNLPAVEESETKAMAWDGPEPKKTQYGFKLMNVDEDGLPHAMFVDAAKPYELGKWYAAEAPGLDAMLQQEPGYVYLMDEDNNVLDRRPISRRPKGGIKGLPSKSAVNQATKEGRRWMTVTLDAKGKKAVATVGINGSEGVSTFALRPGLHAVDIPSMDHIGAKSKGSDVIDTRRPNQRWFLIEYPVDQDYNQEAYSNPRKDIRDHLPTGGWYSFQTNSGAEANQHWFITGGMRIVGAVSEADARKYARDHGFKEDLPWKLGKSYSDDDAMDLAEYIRTTKAQPTPSKEEMRQRITGETQFMSWDGVEERAVEHFGTTDDFRIAGYILGDGRILDFSGAHWLEGYDEQYVADWREKNDLRQVDHEDIYEAFGDGAPSDSALAFIQRGNIRIAPEAPGLEMYAKKEPTAQQYAQIRDFVNYINDRQDYFTNGSRLWIDLTTSRKERGRMSYTGEIRPDRVVNDLKHYYKTGEVREQGASAWFMTWEDQVSFDDLMDENAQMSMDDLEDEALPGEGFEEWRRNDRAAAKTMPGMEKVPSQQGPRRERALAAAITQQTKTLLEGYTPTDWDRSITAEDIDGWLDADEYHGVMGSMFDDGMQAADLLYDLAQAQPEKAEDAYLVMEQLTRTMNPLYAQVYTVPGGYDRTPGFTEWYMKRNPSVYYPGYKPGDLFWNEKQWAFEEDVHENLLKEIEYLARLIVDGNVSETTKADAREFLERLTGRTVRWYKPYDGGVRDYQEVFYMSWDNDHNSWAPEFYSKLNRTVAEWTNDKGRPMPEKMGAGAVIPWLRGRGVKAEEIRWSGLQQWLEGRKSVTKDELAAYLAGNMIDIRTEVRGRNMPEYLYDVRYDPLQIGQEHFRDADDLEEALDKIEDILSKREGKEVYVKTQINDDGVAFYYLKPNGEKVHVLRATMNDAVDSTKWSDHTIKGGYKYREILFVDPRSNYDNMSMRVHWGRPGVLAHARVQDMEEVSEGKQVLFIEELQSDWHNAGAKKDPILGKAAGFASDYDNSAADSVAKLVRERIAVQTEGPKFEEIDALARSLLDRVHKADAEKKYQYSLSRVSILDWLTHDNVGILDDNLLWLSDEEGLQESAEKLALSLMTEKEKDLVKRSRDTYRRVRELTVQENEMRTIMEERPPEAPFAGSSDTYHEYVMKHLLRLAAEGDYDAIGWTTAEQQAERWKDPDTERWEKSKESYRISYDQTLPKFMNKYTKQWGGKVGDMALAVPYTNGQETRVWAVEITPEMKKAVLQEGQPLFMSWDGMEDTEQEWQARLEAYSRLEAEQAIQDQVFQSIRELTRSQKKSLAEIQKRLKIGKTPEARMEDVQRMARSLMSRYNSTLKEEDVIGEIAAIWNYVLQDTDPSGNVVRNMAEELAEKIVDSAEVEVIDETEEETLKEIRNRIRGQKLVIGADETGDIPGYANLAEFRKKNFGRFSVAGRNSDAVTDQHVPVDSLYEELRNSYGDYYFPESTSQGEMLGILSGYFDAAERQTANPFADSYGEAVEAIAGEITRSAWWDAVRLTPLTEAEQAKVRNAEGREIIQNLRSERKITKSQADKLEGPMAAEEQLMDQAEALKAQIRELVEAGEMSKAEAAELQASLLKMTRRVDSLEEQYRLLEEAADKRVAQIREEGAAKVAEAIAKQQEKAAKNVQALKDHFKEVQQNARARREESGNVKKYRNQITHQVEALRKWMMSPSNKNVLQHIPAEIQKTVADFLESISLVSKTYLRTGGLETTRADDRYLRSMKRMRDAIKANVNLQGQYSGYNDLPPDFVENFEKMIEQTETFIKSNPGGFIVNRMTGAELRELRDTLKILRKYITQMNEFHNNAMFQHAYEAGDDTIVYLSQFAKSKSSGVPYKFMRFDYMRPSYAFEHFGKGGQSIEHEFREGQAVQAFLANEIIDFAKRTYTSKEVKDWSRENKTFELSDGQTVTVPVTHLMSLYCLNKREQARLHIYGDGIRIANFQNGKDVELDEGHLVSIADVQKMIGALTDRQKEVADALQKFMSTEAAKWGNYVSMARFDVEQFTEQNYFPINSDGRYLSTTADESPDNSGLYALLNSGFTKELKENARNRIILYNVFDVFANHTASMAQYRAFALPMLDALKWFNYKDPNTSVRAKLSSAFGAPLDERAGSGAKGYAEQFVINLLKAYNGTSAQGDPYDTTALKFLHRFNGAAIAYNLRVIVQQPTAITRAAMILSPDKLVKGLGMSIAQMRKLADEMEAHSGIAAWKSLGFYDTNISRGLTDLIKQNPSILDRVMDVGTKGAEMADRFTWAAMWYAAKDSVKRSDYATEEDYFKAVTELFEEVIYKTQVVDSLLTKAEFLRSKGAIARQLGSFMSEPSATMSMLTDAYYKYTDDLQRGLSRSEAWKKNGANIARTAAVYAIGQVILSAAQAVIDAWRDDDEYDPDSWWHNYLLKYLNAFKSNLVEEEMVFGKIPVISELYDLLKGYLSKFGFFDKLGLDIYGNDVSSGLAMYTKYLTKTIDIIAEKIVNGKSNYTNYSIIYNLLRFASNVSGIPFGTAWREIQDVWNNTVGFYSPSRKLVTYERALDKTYEEYIRSSGMAKKDYEKILDEADSDGGISPTQDELGAYLLVALEKGTVTEEQAQALWTSRWNKPTSTTFDKWREKNAALEQVAQQVGFDLNGETAPEAKPAETLEPKTKPAPMPTPEPTPTPTPTPAPALTAAPKPKPAEKKDDKKVTDRDTFKKYVPVYSDNADTAYDLYESEVRPLGISLEKYSQIIIDANADGKGTSTQDEMGNYLVSQVKANKITQEQADAIWHTIWSKPKSKTFQKWLQKNYNG